MTNIFKDNLRSSDRDQKILNFTVGLAAAVVFAKFIPGFDYLQAAGMVIDVIDPYDYSKSFNRDGINKLSQDSIDELVRALNDPKIRQPIFDNICKQYSCTDPSAHFTADKINKTIDHFLSYWMQKIVSVKQGCYGNPTTLDGPPTDDCYPIYKQTYNDFYTKNFDAYKNGNYAVGTDFYKVIVGVKVNTFRKNIFTICGVFLIIFFIIFIFIVYKLNGNHSS